MMRALLALACAAACGNASHGTVDGAVDADATEDAATDDSASAGSRCTTNGAMLTCTSHAVQLGGRTVTFEVPLGAPPAAGWPAVVLLPGLLRPRLRCIRGRDERRLRAILADATVKALLDDGFAVIAPNALANGSQYWQTNVPPYAANGMAAPTMSSSISCSMPMARHDVRRASTATVATRWASRAAGS